MKKQSIATFAVSDAQLRRHLLLVAEEAHLSGDRRFAEHFLGLAHDMFAAATEPQHASA